MSLNYREMFDQIKAQIVNKRAELSVCIARVDELEDEIVALQQTASGLAKTLREEYVAEDELGLTDAIRKVFKQNASKDFTALEVKAELEEMGYNLSKYGNVMASIHSVINRILGKDIRQSGTKTGKPCYRWVTQNALAARLAEAGKLTPGEAKQMMQEHAPKK